MKELTIKALVEHVDDVLDFINAELEQADCSMKLQMQIDIAVEEIYVNIAHYAYPGTEGDATILCEVSGDPLCCVITFVDSGIPYDPLAKEDPDITLSAEERDIGGLGIYMVKKSMDDVTYEYVNGQNRLTIRKAL